MLPYLRLDVCSSGWMDLNEIHYESIAQHICCNILNRFYYRMQRSDSRDKSGSWLFALVCANVSTRFVATGGEWLLLNEGLSPCFATTGNRLMMGRVAADRGRKSREVRNLYLAVSNEACRRTPWLLTTVSLCKHELAVFLQIALALRRAQCRCTTIRYLEYPRPFSSTGSQ